MSGAFEITMDFDEQDINRFAGAMDKLVSECGWSPHRAGKYATIMLLKSLRASTKKSKPRRKVKVASRKRVGRKRRFEVEAYSNGQARPFYVFEYSLQEAKSRKYAQVQYSGLAKKSWGWAMQDLFNTGGGGAVRFARPGGAVTASGGGKKEGQYSVVIDNNLRYIREAFRVAGEREVATAMHRAGKAMEYKIDQELKKAEARQ